MRSLTAAEMIGCVARVSGNTFAAGIAASVAAAETDAGREELAAFEHVVTLILDDTCDELVDELRLHSRGLVVGRVRDLAADFLVAWSDNLASEATAVIDGDGARLAMFEAERVELIARLVDTVTTQRLTLVSIAGGLAKS